MSDEYIKKEDALKAVDDIVCDADDAERTCDRIIDLPSADVAPVRRGRWECGEENSWWCSVCDEEFYLEDGTPQENGYRFCPNCGARMDGGIEDE